MIQSKGKIARVHHGLLHFAEVELTVSSADEMVVTFDCHGEEFISQGYIEVVPAKGYDDWKHGALAGITYALGKCSDHPCNVTVTYIAGLSTDTNPSIVGGLPSKLSGLLSSMRLQPKSKPMSRRLFFRVLPSHLIMFLTLAHKSRIENTDANNVDNHPSAGKVIRHKHVSGACFATKMAKIDFGKKGSRTLATMTFVS